METTDGTPSEPPPLGQSVEMTADDCWERLAASPVGRIAYLGTHGPQIRPVNHVVHDGCIAFRTAAYGDLAGDVRDSLVAFEVDEEDTATRTGWSVLVVGSARYVDDADELVELWAEADAQPLAPGTRSLYVRITPDKVTGRRVTAP